MLREKITIAFILSKKPSMVWKIRMSNEPYNSIQNKNISKEGKEQIDSNKKIFNQTSTIKNQINTELKLHHKHSVPGATVKTMLSKT